MIETKMDYRQLVRNTLKSEAYWIINKTINKILGLECALFLSDLISKEEYFDRRGMLQENGSFFNSVKNTKKDTGLSEHIQKKALKILKEYDLLDVKRRGVPPKRLYKLNWLKITYLISQNTTNRIDGDISIIINNNKYNKNKDNNVILKNNIKDESQIRQTNPLLDYWNSLENVRKHMSTTTKTYVNCAKAIRSLKAGTFYRKNTVSPEFLKKHHLPNPRDRKFTCEEIKLGMAHLSLLLTGGYGYGQNNFTWPDDNLKQRLRNMSLAVLLYNKETNTSIFLLALHNKPQLLKNIDQSIPFNLEYYSIMEVLINSKYRPLDVYKKKQLIYRIGQMLKFQKGLIKKHISMQQNFNFQRKIGYEDDPTHFLNTYIEWMTDNVDIPISIKMIGPDGFCWPDFCQYLKTECYCQNL